MSRNGILLAAKVMSEMQEARRRLLEMGTVEPITESSRQDILLGQMFETAKEAIKEDFSKITIMKAD